MKPQFELFALMVDIESKVVDVRSVMPPECGITDNLASLIKTVASLKEETWPTPDDIIARYELLQSTDKENESRLNLLRSQLDATHNLVAKLRSELDTTDGAKLHEAFKQGVMDDIVEPSLKLLQCWDAITTKDNLVERISSFESKCKADHANEIKLIRLALR